MHDFNFQMNDWVPPLSIPEEIHQMNSSQLMWLSGYLYCLAQKQTEVDSFAETTPSAKPTDIVYGSQTGNSLFIAEGLAAAIKSAGYSARVLNMADLPKSALRSPRRLLLIISTHGNGEPPDEAKEFYDYIMTECREDLSHIEYAVLALGDSSYEFYCKTGHDFDAKLAELGATRELDLIECDVDYKPQSEKWKKDVLEQIAKESKSAPSKIPTGNVIPFVQAKKEHNRANPFSSELQKKIQLCDRGAEKEVYHLEFSLKDSGLVYRPGDSLGVFPKNKQATVSKFIDLLELDSETKISFSGKLLPLQTIATEHLDLSAPHKHFLESLLKFNDSPHLKKVLCDPEKTERLLENFDVVGLLQKYPAKTSPDKLIEIIPEIRPRLYSIASSPHMHEDEVHLTVRTEEFLQKNIRKRGLCSGFLSEIQSGETARIYVHPNHRFRLPEDKSNPMIMIGAGTGIAPYRSFLYEREALGYTGTAWLFFGEQKFRSTFLYQAEIRKFLKKGTLTRFNAAFSRDGIQKEYVQHKLKENAEELFEWIRQGALIYLCGDAKKMAVDVETTLLEIFVGCGKMKESQAQSYLKELAATRKYNKDVY